MSAFGRIASLSLLVLASCNFSSLDELSIDNVDQADAELETSSHWMWTKYDSANTEALTELAGRLALIVDAARKNGDMPLQRRLTRLSQDDIGAVGLKDRDASQAVGMMIATDVECTLEQVEHITVSKQQKTLYPDVYLTYDRAYSTSDADYFARKVDRLKWITTLSADVKGEYTSKLDGTIHYVAGAGPNGQPVLMVRSYFPEPAKFTSPDNTWTQDYQVEVYYESSPGNVVHLYALWRDLKIGSITLETEFATSVQLANMIDWDVHTSKLCKAGTLGD